MPFMVLWYKILILLLYTENDAVVPSSQHQRKKKILGAGYS